MIQKDSEKLLIFDFDGTLCDSFACFVKVINELAPIFRFKTISSEFESEQLKTMTTHEIIKRLQVSRWKMPLIAIAMRQRMYRYRSEIRFFPEVTSTLKTLENRCSLSILSSNGKSLIDHKLKDLNIGFQYVVTGTKLHGKEQKLRKFLAKNAKGIPRSKIYYIGDELRDVEAALAVGIVPIAVTWGYQSASILSQRYHSYVANSWGEVINKITCA